MIPYLKIIPAYLLFALVIAPSLPHIGLGSVTAFVAEHFWAGLFLAGLTAFALSVPVNRQPRR